ncbi:E motif [Dillenia turbinata]|uniref:E motif n=1 Tax=Dillenia turbinata TaxID=194707 RepID=A0AAN8V3C3_9MAGN
MTLYMPLFKSCSTVKTLSQLHAHLLTTGLHKGTLASTKLIESYAKMGSLESARLVFEKFQTPDSFMWGVLIKCYVWNRFYEEAISLYHEMSCCYHETQFSSFIFPPILRACSNIGEVGIGQKVHGRIIKYGLDSDTVVQTSLLSMYGETASLSNAKKVFDEMLLKDVVSWCSIISSYLHNGKAKEGLELFRQMVSKGVEPDSVTMLSVAEVCGQFGSWILARSVHGHAVRREIQWDGSLGSSLVAMYSKCGDLYSAERLFRCSSNHSAALWTTMISCYNQSGCFQEAIDMFEEMQVSNVEPNSVTMISVLCSCARIGWLKGGKSVHCFVIRKAIDHDMERLGPALIDLYGNCGKIRDCQNVFNMVEGENIVTWNILMSVFARKGKSEDALTLFSLMHKQGLLPDSFSLASALSVCGDIGSSDLGHQIHGYVIKAGILCEFVQNSLIDMYSKSGLVDSANQIFEDIEWKTVVTWNSMICGFSQNGNSVEAISLFDKMYLNCLEIDKVALLSVIQACSHLGYLEKGKWVHHKLICNGVKGDTYIETSLIDMYAKCGALEIARRVFDNMEERSVVSWSAMIAGYGMHGQINDAISLFSQMVELGIKPNEITFMNILSACSHTCFVEEGKAYFASMTRDFGIEPISDHYTCIVDLLSRAGDLSGAYNIIKSMSFPAGASIWGAFLNGCRIHREMDMLKRIPINLLDADYNSAGYHSLLSDIYAEGGKWDEFGKVRLKMRSAGLRKVPGCSIIEIEKRIYRFGAGDTSHSQTKEIYRFLEDFVDMAQKAGYTEKDLYMTDTGEFPRGNNVISHGERLAIAFGILNTSPGTTLRISKNLRVCRDCHSFTKIVSKLTGRTIIMRDLNRFHHFKDGFCSCRDYW